MAYLDEVQDALDEAYAEFGVSALWTPVTSGAVLDVTLIPDTSDGTGSIPGVGRVVSTRNVYLVRASELAALGYAPTRGDIVAVGKVTLRIDAAPVRKGPMRLEWRWECV